MPPATVADNAATVTSRVNIARGDKDTDGRLHRSGITINFAS